MAIFTGKVDATFVSVWDGGDEVACECVVDLDEMCVVSLGRYLCGSPDDDVDVLDEQYVVLCDGTRYTAASADDTDAYDEYGNGIVRYGW